MKREPILWLAALTILFTMWSVVPVALRKFDPVQTDVQPGEFLGLGPPWFYLALLVNAVATISFVIAFVIRICVLAISLWQNRAANVSD